MSQVTYVPILWTICPQTRCLDFMEEITNAKDSNKHAVSLFIDIEKASATMYNEILQKILLCAWHRKWQFKSYLSM